MIVMFKQEDGEMTVSASDPTQKLTEASITFSRAGMKANELDWRAAFDEETNTLKLNFAGCGGATVENTLALPTGGASGGGGGAGGGAAITPDKENTAGNDSDTNSEKCVFSDVPKIHWAFV